MPLGIAGRRFPLASRDPDPEGLRTLDLLRRTGTERTPSGSLCTRSPVTLDLEDADVHKVFGAVAHLLSSRLLIDIALAEASITIRHEEQPISDFLDDVCREIGCEWTFVPGEEPLLSVEASPSPPLLPRGPKRSTDRRRIVRRKDTDRNAW